VLRLPDISHEGRQGAYLFNYEHRLNGLGSSYTADERRALTEIGDPAGKHVDELGLGVADRSLLPSLRAEVGVRGEHALAVHLLQVTFMVPVTIHIATVMVPRL